ncbi:leucine-rich repeat-containing protein 70 isoform X1 [Nasonia vitripennis]|uniref:Uncharacterized protein n=1 Tax=Nasonia vitripennis TaxID=7425 RepID=A0A7M7LQH4_NASVI|nr:leucine-rich repeat-containing protein 70 isoform X1 [Nasonia vitripennis]
MYRRAQIWICYTLCLALVSLPRAARGNITTAATKTLDWCIPQCMCLSNTQILCNTGGLRDIPTSLPSNLEELSLSKNEFGTIRNDAFSQLRHLKKLYLDGNVIQEIRPFAFRGLNKLLALSIQYTPLSYIGEFSFAALQNVSGIVLSHNKIAHIKANAFAGSSHIGIIVLSNNPLKSIHSHAFSGLTYVGHLVLPGGIKSIEPDAFNGLEQVGQLKMTFMDLEGVKPYTFRGLKNVNHLLIQTSDLGVIHKDAFFGLEHIDQLNIVSNKIDAIEEFHLASNFSINVLHFHKNHVLKAPKYGDASFRVNRISTEENHFPCDCQIHLVLESDFVNGSVDEFRRHNFCISTAEFNGKPMSVVDLESIASCHDRLTKDNYGSGVSVRSNRLCFALVIGFMGMSRRLGLLL